MAVQHSPPTWPEQHRFSSPPLSSVSTHSPNLPDDVLAIPKEKETPPFKKALRRASNTIKRYTLTPSAAYPHWEAYTPQHVRPEVVDERERGGGKLVPVWLDAMSANEGCRVGLGEHGG